MAIITGLSGNELYCLKEKGYGPGNLVIGNSVFALGFVGGIASGLKTLGGGEVHEITEIIREGRSLAYMRMVEEARRHIGVGVTGVASQLIFHDSNIEYLSIGSTVHREAGDPPNTDHLWSTSANGQELYCQLDCGFEPVQFVFGNVAYSIGIGGGIKGAIRSLKSGEVIEYSNMLSHTRHLALERITAEAKTAGANAVLGINTVITPISGMQEMLMTGTASHNTQLPSMFTDQPITSDLTNEEMWNVIHSGYCPIKLVLGVSVFSLGFAGGVKAMLKSFVRGEITELTYLIYQARVRALAMIAEDAATVDADDVVGVKTYVYDFGGGVVELLAIGTAIKKMPNMKPRSPQLIPQAIIKDVDTFTNKVPMFVPGSSPYSAGD
ncbi:MAG TPA: heavy metal-binding domain-containing protein [Drouetiella sp.]